jgi:hypothetical protein
MYQALYKYFLIYKKIALPGIGVFKMQPVAANLDVVKGVLHAPNSEVTFTATNVQADKNIFYYLSKELKIEEWLAVKKFQEYCLQISENLGLDGSVQLPGMGKLQKGYNDDIFFTSTLQNNNSADTDLKLNRATDSKANLVELYATGETLIVIEETEDDKLEQIIKNQDEDYWWVYAVILALMGVGALLYYYI